MISWIDTETPRDVTWHLPEADIKSPSGPFIWDLYSPQRLVEFELEVYSRACEAYDEALAHSFSRLGWAMPSSALAPFGVVLELQREPEGLRHIRGLTVMRAPMPILADIAGSGRDVKWSASRRAVVAPNYTRSLQGQGAPLGHSRDYFYLARRAEPRSIWRSRLDVRGRR